MRIVIVIASTASLFGASLLRAQGEQSWKVSLQPATNPLPIGSCGAVYLTVKDAIGKNAARNPKGQLVGLADFDLTVTATNGNDAVGKYDNANNFAVCACPSGTVGEVATVTATYPARSLKEEARVRGMPATYTLSIPLAPARGGGTPPGCSATSAAPTTATALTSQTPAGAIAGTVAAPSAAPLPAQTRVPNASNTAPVLSTTDPPLGVQFDSTTLNGVSVGYGSYRLTIDGSTSVVNLQSGGSAVGSVTATGSGSSMQKQIGTVSYSPITILSAPTTSLVAWINSSWNGSAVQKSGTLLPVGTVAGYGGITGAGNVAFTNASIVSTTIPALGSSANGLGEVKQLRVTFAPASFARTVSAPGPPAPAIPAIDDFRFYMSGMDTIGVGGIQSFEVGAGGPPNLVVTINAAHAASWIAWYQDFVINGHNDAAHERTFVLDLLQRPAYVTTFTKLGTITGSGVGIITVRALRQGTGVSTGHSSASGSLQVELYVERLEFATPAGTP